jgi:hypothetical protein
MTLEFNILKWILNEIISLFKFHGGLYNQNLLPKLMISNL